MKILCAIDGSRYSRWALDVVCRLDAPPDSSLRLLHVIDIRQFTPRRTATEKTKDAFRQGLDLAEQHGRLLLTRAQERASSKWNAVETSQAKGGPADIILSMAGRQQSDLIVVGSRGLTAFRPYLLGSVSRRVVTGAPCSVLVVKRRPSAFGKILIGVDGSKDAHGAVECFLRLVPHKDTQTTVVSVVPPLPIETESPPEELSALLDEVRRHSEEEAVQIVQRTVDRLQECGIETATVVTHGHVGQQLVELAKSTQADLMVVGSRGLTGTTRYLMGSVSDAVVKYAPCPVLVFRRS